MVTNDQPGRARGAREKRDRRDGRRLPRPLPPDRRDDDEAEGPDHLDAARTPVERVELSAWKHARPLIDPNIIALMLSIGLIGIVVELWNPGLVFPGTVGAISLIVGLYGSRCCRSRRRAAADAARGRVLRRRGVHRLARRARRRGRGHVRDRRADALRPAGEAPTRSRCRWRSRSPARSRSFGFALTKAAQVGRAGRGRLAPARRRAGGRPGEASSSSTGLWHARSASGVPLVPASRCSSRASIRRRSSSS